LNRAAMRLCFYINDVMKISRPMIMRIMPPISPDLLENLFPNFLPMYTPAVQISMVTKEMINAETKAMLK